MRKDLITWNVKCLSCGFTDASLHLPLAEVEKNPKFFCPYCGEMELVPFLHAGDGFCAGNVVENGRKEA